MGYSRNRSRKIFSTSWASAADQSYWSEITSATSPGRIFSFWYDGLNASQREALLLNDWEDKQSKGRWGSSSVLRIQELLKAAGLGWLKSAHFSRGRGARKNMKWKLSCSTMFHSLKLQKIYDKHLLKCTRANHFCLVNDFGEGVTFEIVLFFLHFHLSCVSWSTSKCQMTQQGVLGTQSCSW